MSAQDYTFQLVPPLDTKSLVKSPLKILLSIGGSDTPSPFLIDTGSTGIVASPRWIGPRYIDTGLPFKLTYTSSQNSYVGTWVIAPVTFHSSPTPEHPECTQATTTPMLIRRVRLHSEFPDASHAVAMLGVGFDRDTGPNLNPPTNILPVPLNINPFLMLPAMLSGSIEPGYVITPTSVTLGITQATIHSFDFIIPLDRLGSECKAPMVEFKWKSAANEAEDNVFSFQTELLIDTGLGYSIIQAPISARPPLDHGGDHLKPGQEITLSYNGKPFYSFITTDSSVQNSSDAPQYVSWRHHLHEGHAFINTSRNPLAEFDYMYAVGPESGKLGFRFRSGPPKN